MRAIVPYLISTNQQRTLRAMEAVYPLADRLTPVVVEDRGSSCQWWELATVNQRRLQLQGEMLWAQMEASKPEPPTKRVPTGVSQYGRVA